MPLNFELNTLDISALFASTAKRLRPRAQGCFNPGKTPANDFNRKAVAFVFRTKLQMLKAQRNPFRVEFTQRAYPGLNQPWAPGRNRFAVQNPEAIIRTF